MPGDAPQPSISGIVLAGGRSTRMEQDKAALLLDGETLLHRTVRALAVVAEEIVIVRSPGTPRLDLGALPPVRVVEDAVEGQGPLVGMAAGLEAARAPIAIVVGVDMPFLRPALLRLLVARVAAGARWVFPVGQDGPQPLCSAIARDALPVLRARIEAGDRAPMALEAPLGGVRLLEQEWRAADPDGASFMDVDTPEDFAAALAILAQRGGLRDA